MARYSAPTSWTCPRKRTPSPNESAAACASSAARSGPSPARNNSKGTPSALSNAAASRRMSTSFSGLRSIVQARDRRRREQRRAAPGPGHRPFLEHRVEYQRRPIPQIAKQRQGLRSRHDDHLVGRAQEATVERVVQAHLPVLGRRAMVEAHPAAGVPA